LVYIEEDLPLKLSEAIAKLPVVGSKKGLEDLKKFKKV